jgi:hypothetical protein
MKCLWSTNRYQLACSERTRLCVYLRFCEYYESEPVSQTVGNHAIVLFFPKIYLGKLLWHWTSFVYRAEERCSSIGAHIGQG